MYKLNTSNKNKLKDYREILGTDIEVMEFDLPEPDTDPMTVIQYKASQFEGVLVDDASLEIEGEDIGVNIKWHLENLPKYIGKNATYTCFIGIKKEGQVFIFKGEVLGEITAPRGEGFGFTPYFLPKNNIKTLAEDRAYNCNARYFAIMNFLENKPTFILPELKNWAGKFQNN